MPEELLQRLRDIHYPAEPGWWPPAPGWWLLAVVVLCAVAIAWRALRTAQRARAPYASAVALLNREFAALRAGRSTERAYLDGANAIIKRLLIHVRRDAAAAPASGAPWLRQLDELSATDGFTSGPGQMLGEYRFAPERNAPTDQQAPPFSAQEVHPLVLALIDKLAASR